MMNRTTAQLAADLQLAKEMSASNKAGGKSHSTSRRGGGGSGSSRSSSFQSGPIRSTPRSTPPATGYGSRSTFNSGPHNTGFAATAALSTIGLYTVGSLNSARRVPAPAESHQLPRSDYVPPHLAHTRVPATVPIAPIQAPIASAHLNDQQSSPVHAGTVGGTVSDGRELIVTNWTDKPIHWPPAHLLQPSAYAVIQDAADLNDVPVDSLTEDGCSMPRSREGAQASRTSQQSGDNVYQAAVNPTGWFTAATAPRATSTTTPNQNRVSSDNSMDYEMTDGPVKTKLDDSIWANKPNQPTAPVYSTQTQRSAFVARPTAPAKDAGHVDDLSNWELANKKENVPKHGGHSGFGAGLSNNFSFSQVSCPAPNPESRPAAFAFSQTAHPTQSAPALPKVPGAPREKSLADSRWA